jgi:hypothetical protein
MQHTDRPQLPKSDLRWLHLDGINHLHEKLNVQEAPDRDMHITYKERVTTYNHSTDLDTNLNLGVRAYSIGATTGGGDAEQRRHERQGTTGILAQHIPWWLLSMAGWR